MLAGVIVLHSTALSLCFCNALLDASKIALQGSEVLVHRFPVLIPGGGLSVVAIVSFWKTDLFAILRLLDVTRMVVWEEAPVYSSSDLLKE